MAHGAFEQGHSPGAIDFGRKRFGHRGHQPLDANQRHHPLDVVGEDVQRDFRLHVPQPPRQEMGCAHPSMYGAERVLNGAAAVGSASRLRDRAAWQERADSLR